MAATRTHMLSKHFKTMKTKMRQTKLPLKIWISMLNNSKSKRWPYREWAIWKSSSNISTHYRKCTRKMRSPEKVEDNKELSCQDSRIKPSDPPKTTFTNSINKAWTKFAPKPYKMINRRIWSHKAKDFKLTYPTKWKGLQKLTTVNLFKRVL